MSTGAAAKWLSDRGFKVANRTVQSWCAKGGPLASEVFRTPTIDPRRGQFRIRLSTLQRLLATNGIATAA